MVGRSGADQSMLVQELTLYKGMFWGIKNHSELNLNWHNNAKSKIQISDNRRNDRRNHMARCSKWREAKSTFKMWMTSLTIWGRTLKRSWKCNGKSNYSLKWEMEWIIPGIDKADMETILKAVRDPTCLTIQKQTRRYRSQIRRTDPRWRHNRRQKYHRGHRWNRRVNATTETRYWWSLWKPGSSSWAPS